MAINGRWRRSRRAILTAGPILVVAAGCQPPPPPPPVGSTNVALTEEERSRRMMLDDAEQAEIVAAMASAAPSERPAAAPVRGMRFTDVERALRGAGGEAGIETAIVDTEVMTAVVRDDAGLRRVPYAYRFRLRTIEDWPGELVVVRVDGPAVYAADGWIGRFPGEPDRYERKEALLRALRERMVKLGERERLPE